MKMAASPKNQSPTRSRHPSMKKSDDRETSADETNYSEESSSLEQKGRKTFPLFLHDMLDEAESNGTSDIVSWQPHGRSFRIHKPKEFVRHIMRNRFRQSKWSSFQRQLNLYGFIRVTTKGPDKGAYYHEHFLRGQKMLSKQIVRHRVKGTKVRKASSEVDAHPNFYAMPPSMGGSNISPIQIYDGPCDTPLECGEKQLLSHEDRRNNCESNAVSMDNTESSAPATHDIPEDDWLLSFEPVFELSLELSQHGEEHSLHQHQDQQAATSSYSCDFDP